MNAFYVPTRTDDLKTLSFFNALARSGVQIYDVALRVRPLFLFFFRADDLGSCAKSLITDISGAKTCFPRLYERV